MDSTNYYIVHKSGRRLKITCIGYSHSAEMKKETLKQIAKIEHSRPDQYKIETEKENEGANKPRTGRIGIVADFAF